MTCRALVKPNWQHWGNPSISTRRCLRIAMFGHEFCWQHQHPEQRPHGEVDKE